MLCSLAKLVNRLCQGPADQCGPLVTALVLPLLAHIQASLSGEDSKHLRDSEVQRLEEVLHLLVT